MAGRRGPAPKGEFPGQSAVLSTRIRPEQRKALEDAAEASGRSLSQEIEYRLRSSFFQEKEIVQAFGSQKTFAIMRMMAAVAEAMMNVKSRDAHWTSDAYLFDQVTKSMMAMLELIRPPGDLPTKIDDQLDHGGVKQGLWRAVLMMKEIKEVDPALPVTVRSKDKQLAVRLKHDLGEIVDRTVLPLKPSTGTPGWNEDAAKRARKNARKAKK